MRTKRADPLTHTEAELSLEMTESDQPVGSATCGPKSMVIQRLAADGEIYSGMRMQDLVFAMVGKAAKGLDQATPSSTSPSAETASGGKNFDAEDRRLMNHASQAWSEFRNGDENAEARHGKALDRLFQRNICWGRVGDSQADYDFHRCAADSIQKQVIAPGSDSDLCSKGDHEACLRL